MSSHKDDPSKRSTEPSSAVSSRIPSPQELAANLTKINLTVMPERRGEHLEVTYILDGQHHFERLDLNADAIRALHLRHFETTRAALDGSEDIQTMAEIGYQTFLRLFTNDDFRTAVRAAIEASPDFRIEIVGDPHLIPWGVIYTHPPDVSFDARHFIGVKAKMKRTLRSEKFAKAPSPAILAATPRIQFGLNSDLTHARTVEHPFISGLSTSFDMLPAFGGDIPAGRRRLRELLIGGNADFVHFACHGTGLDDVGCASITIDSAFKIRSDILFYPGDRLACLPVVFLNACEMAIRVPDQYQSLVRPFLDSGARAVVAPECRVPDDRAALFACDVYGRMFNEGMSLADAVLDATAFRCAQADPIGLAYTVYGQGDARLQKVETPAA